MFCKVFSYHPYVLSQKLTIILRIVLIILHSLGLSTLIFETETDNIFSFVLNVLYSLERSTLIFMTETYNNCHFYLKYYV